MEGPYSQYDAPASNLAPIAFFTYNRPLHTQLSLEALRMSPLACSSDLFVFSDAARTDLDSRKVEQVRSYVSGIRGFKSVQIVLRETNFGLRRSIIDGVSELCRRYGRVIVLEDDLICSERFLDFVNAGLRRYESVENVMQISGYQFPNSLESEDDGLLMPFITSWGWGTWDRAWRYFGNSGGLLERLGRERALRYRFNLNGRYDYYAMATAQAEGKIDSWAIEWYLSVFNAGGLSLFPRKTLIYNGGFDGTGVNCTVSEMAQDKLWLGKTEWRFPEEIMVSPLADAFINSIPRPRLTVRSVMRYLKSFAAQHFMLKGER